MLNPLTLEERLKAGAIIAWDTLAVITGLFDRVEQGLRAEGLHLSTEFRKEQLSLLELARYNAVHLSNADIHFAKNDYLNLFEIPARDLEIGLNVIKERARVLGQIKNRDVEYNVSSSESVTLNVSALYVASLFLFRDCLDATTDDGKIRISVSDYSGQVPEQNVVFRSKDSPLSGRFVKIDFSHNGARITREMLEQYRAKGVPAPEEGGSKGNYISSLLMKYVGGHFSISSRVGNTEFSLYFPVRSKE